jgi:uncharacterized protein YdaU (DUF1376 family)
MLRAERHDWLEIVGDPMKRHLTTEEKGVLMVMLGTMRLYGGWLPADDKKLAAALGLTRHRWVKYYKPVLMRFFAERPDPVRGAVIEERH